MQDFNKLDALAKEMAQRDYLIKKRKRLAEELNNLSQEEIRLQSQLKKETTDYAKIEGLSIKKLLKLFSEHYEEMMDKEYREMKIAQYKHDALLEHMKSSQDEIANISELLSQYETVDTSYNTLLNAKRNWLAQNGIMVVENYESSIRRFESRQKEIDEALIVCRKLIASLSSAKDDLASAKGWGMFETLGDGLISDIVKQDQLKRVSQYILDSSEKAKRLTSELSDLKPYFDFEIVEIDALSKTYDIFFDQIFLDSAIQRQIEDAYLKICKNQALAESVLKKLEALNTDTMNNLNTITQKRNEVLLSL
jgi:hypothetical protein